MACCAHPSRGGDEAPRHALVDVYNKLVEQARTRRLPNEASRPGIATVTTSLAPGIVGPLPLRLPEQNLVLGLGAGRKAPGLLRQRR